MKSKSGYDYSIEVEIQDMLRIECGKIEDIEGYVWNRLLFDGGVGGAKFYGINKIEFKNYVLNAMDTIIKANQ